MGSVSYTHLGDVFAAAIGIGQRLPDHLPAVVLGCGLLPLVIFQKLGLVPDCITVCIGITVFQIEGHFCNCLLYTSGT